MQDLKVRKVRLVLQDHRAILARRVTLVRLAILAQQDQLVQRVRKASRATPET